MNLLLNFVCTLCWCARTIIYFVSVFVIIDLSLEFKLKTMYILLLIEYKPV